MRRGEVWYARFTRAQGGPRPVVLLSRDESYAVRDLVIVGYITTRIRNIPSEVPLGRAEGLPRRCVANLDVIETILKRRLERRLGALAQAKLARLDEALRFALGLGD